MSTVESIGNQFGYLCPKCKQGDDLEIVGDIEPRLRGPYKNTDTRDRAAKRLREKDAGKENGIFALDMMNNGKIRVWAYSAGFLDESVATKDEYSNEDHDEKIRFVN